MHRDVSILPIVASTEDHELKGILTHEDIISAYKVNARKRALFSNHHNKLSAEAVKECAPLQSSDVSSDDKRAKEEARWG
jgi:hypothetical protein